MSEKWSTVIFIVDLECKRCNSKIKKTICKLQDRYKIRTVEYDEKKKTVTISGPFDPNKVIKKICCKACEVIKEIEIVEKKPDPPPKKPAPPPEPAPAPPAPDPCPPPSQPEPDPAPPEPEPCPAPEPEPEPAPEPEVQRVEPTSKPVEPAQPCPPRVWGPGTGCCCRPWFEPYYGGCKCCSCGWVYYWPVPVCVEEPKPTYVYGGPCYGGPRVCEYVYEEEPSGCMIM